MGVTLKRPDVLAGWWSVNDTATRQRPGLDSRQVCSHQAHVSQIRVTAGNRSRRSFRTSNRFYSNRPFLASSGRFCLTSPFDVIQKQQVWNFEPNTNLHLSTEKDFSVWIRLTSFCLFLACSTFFIDDLDLKSSLDVSTDGRVGPALGFHAGGCCSEPCWIICYWSYGDVLLNRTTMFLHPSGVTVIKTCQCL